MTRKSIIYGVVLVGVILASGLILWSIWSGPSSNAPTVPAVNNDELLNPDEEVTPTEEGEPASAPAELRTGEEESRTPPISSKELTRTQDPVIPSETNTPGTDSTDPHIKAGKDFMKVLQFVEAEGEFALANQNDPVTQYYRGLLASYQGNRASATSYLTQAVTIGSDQKVNTYSNNVLKAYQLFDTYQDGKSEFMDTLLSKEYLTAGEIELAIDKLKFVTSQVPSYTDAWILLGSAYMVYGKYDQATETLTKVLPSDRGEVYYWLGLSYLYQDLYQKAIASFQQALAKNYQPSHKVHEKLGDSYLAQEDWAKAAIEYEEVLKSADARQYIDSYIRPVWLYIDLLGQPQKALELSEQALEEHPNSAMANNLMGWSSLAAGKFPDAKEYLEKAIELDDELPAAYLNLGNYYRAQADLQNAKKNYEQAADQDPDGAVGDKARELIEEVEEEMRKSTSTTGSREGIGE